jgi:hypothetical protein
MNSRSIFILISVASLLLGIGTDFIVSGVLKIVWAWIYVTLYLTLASAYLSYLHQTQLSARASRIAGIFLLSCFLGHWSFSQTTELRTYPMDLPRDAQEDSRIALHSQLLSRTLFITSDSVKKKLDQENVRVGIPVKIQVTKNYGCIDSFRVKEVDGVDVMFDQDAFWTWRQEGVAPSDTSKLQGLDEENHQRSWCLIRCEPTWIFRPLET